MNRRQEHPCRTNFGLVVTRLAIAALSAVVAPYGWASFVAGSTYVAELHSISPFGAESLGLVAVATVGDFDAGGIAPVSCSITVTSPPASGYVPHVETFLCTGPNDPNAFYAGESFGTVDQLHLRNTYINSPWNDPTIDLLESGSTGQIWYAVGPLASSLIPFEGLAAHLLPEPGALAALLGSFAGWRLGRRRT